MNLHLAGCTDILAGISSPVRLQILQHLHAMPLKPSKLSQEMGISIQGLTRHLEKLIESGLIERTQDGMELSQIGHIALKHLPNFQFLSKYRDYFKDHTFEGVPSHLMLRIGDLYESELETDTMKALQRCRQNIIDNKEWCCAVTISIPLEFFDLFEESKINKVRYQFVYGKNTYVSKGFYDYPARKGSWTKAMSDGQAEERYVKKVAITVTATEGECHLLFANKNLGEPDNCGIFFGNNDSFRKWCLDLFHYYWNDVPKIPATRLQERG